MTKYLCNSESADLPLDGDNWFEVEGFDASDAAESYAKMDAENSSEPWRNGNEVYVIDGGEVKTFEVAVDYEPAYFAMEIR